MSGRLVILPKKSYCPWNPKNVARVDRDEREHQEKLDRQQQQKAQEQSHTRLLVLRKRAREEIDDNCLQRFNLFEKEERDHQERTRDELLRQGNPAKLNDERHVEKRGNPGTFPSKNDEIPFYMKSNLDGDKSTKRNVKMDAGVKERLDPMRQFHLHHEQDSRVPSSTQQITTPKEHTAKDEKQNASKRRQRRSPDSENHHDDTSGTSPSASSRGERRKNKRLKKAKKKSRKQKRNNSKETRGEDFPNDESDGNANANDTLVELRRRRAEREESERKRQDHLLGSTLEKRQYYDQYNPRLSRK
jgi:hypothetical protein